MTPTIRTATCACRTVSITVAGDPVIHGGCHSGNCKRRTGSAFGISTYFKRSAVVTQTGATRVYAFKHKSRQHDQQRHFCETCGTTLFWHVPSQPELVGIAGGCFERGSLGSPTSSLAHDQKADWVGLPAQWRRVGG